MAPQSIDRVNGVWHYLELRAYTFLLVYCMSKTRIFSTQTVAT